MDLQYCEHANGGNICQNLRNDHTQEQFYGTCALNCYTSVKLVSNDNCFPEKSSTPRIKGDISKFYLKPNKYKD